MKKTIKKIASNVIPVIFIILSVIVVISCNYVIDQINCSSFEQMLYTLNTVQGASTQPLNDGIIYVLIRLSIILLFFFLIRYVVKRRLKFENVYLELNERKFKVFPFNKIFISIVFVLFAFLYSFYGLKINEYFQYKNEKAEIIEKNYVDPRNILISFPEEKRNLIYIYVESLENSAMSKENGGLQEESYIPNLERLASTNTNFSNTDKLGGGYATFGSTWTIAGMVSQSAGLPLKLSVGKENSYTSNNYLNGSYTLGDILKDNGYKNYFILGEDSNFAGARDYYTQHGDYTIYDYDWAVDSGLIPKGYFEWWGFEDRKLFEFSKERLTEISKNDEPFNFVIETMDTHFVDGYVDDTCDTKFDTKYANAYYCSDYMIGEFIDWVKEQDFYENTTIIISGDHLTMQNGFFVPEDPNYERTVYNVIINSPIEAEYTKNRKFNTIDMFPTTIASIGGTIQGERLGLGTNLYSGTKTLIERNSLEYINKELSKQSDYYNKVILGNEYILYVK